MRRPEQTFFDDFFQFLKDGTLQVELHRPNVGSRSLCLNVFFETLDGIEVGCITPIKVGQECELGVQSLKDDEERAQWTYQGTSEG